MPSNVNPDTVALSVPVLICTPESLSEGIVFIITASARGSAFIIIPDFVDYKGHRRFRLWTMIIEPESSGQKVDSVLNNIIRFIPTNIYRFSITSFIDTSVTGYHLLRCRSLEQDHLPRSCLLLNRSDIRAVHRPNRPPTPQDVAVTNVAIISSSATAFVPNRYSYYLRLECLLRMCLTQYRYYIPADQRPNILPRRMMYQSQRSHHQQFRYSFRPNRYSYYLRLECLLRMCLTQYRYYIPADQRPNILPTPHDVSVTT